MAISPDRSLREVEAGSAECTRLCRKPDAQLKFAVDEERAQLRHIWEETQYRKSVKRLEREAEALQRERDAAWRHFRVRAEEWGLEAPATYRANTATSVRAPVHNSLMPTYSFAIRDKNQRLFPFMRTVYSKAATTKRGRARTLIFYQIDGAFVRLDGSRAFVSNIGESREEVGAGFDQLERVNRSAARNAKVVHHTIIQSLYELSPEQQFAMAKRYCEETFARQGLPYSLAMHAPDPGGDQRNWHFHITFSYRPMEREAEGQWKIGRFLRTDLDNPQGWTQMRYLLAEELNHTCKLHNLAKRYTHLSYAASGLDYIPQEHLGPGQTAQVRRGETVAKNERNHRRVLENTARNIIRAMRKTLLATAAELWTTADEKLHVVNLAASVRSARSPLGDLTRWLKTFELPAALRHPQETSGAVSNDNHPAAHMQFSVPRLPKALKSTGIVRQRPRSPGFHMPTIPHPLAPSGRPDMSSPVVFAAIQIPKALKRQPPAASLFRLSVNLGTLPRSLERQPPKSDQPSLRRWSFSLPVPLQKPKPGPAPHIRTLSLPRSFAVPKRLEPSPVVPNGVLDWGKSFLARAPSLPRPLQTKVAAQAASVWTAALKPIVVPRPLDWTQGTDSSEVRSVSFQIPRLPKWPSLAPPLAKQDSRQLTTSVEKPSVFPAEDQAPGSDRPFEEKAGTAKPDFSALKSEDLPQRTPLILRDVPTTGTMDPLALGAGKPRLASEEDKEMAAEHERLDNLRKAEVRKIYEELDALDDLQETAEKRSHTDGKTEGVIPSGNQGSSSNVRKEPGPTETPPPEPEEFPLYIDEEGRLRMRPLPDLPEDEMAELMKPKVLGEDPKTKKEAADEAQRKIEREKQARPMDGFDDYDLHEHRAWAKSKKPFGKLARGLHKEIDLWMDNDRESNLDARLMAAGAIQRDPAVMLLIEEMEPRTRARFESDFEAVKEKIRLSSRAHQQTLGMER